MKFKKKRKQCVVEPLIPLASIGDTLQMKFKSLGWFTSLEFTTPGVLRHQ